MNVCASVHAQTISLNVKQAELTEVLSKIKKQSGYQFLYNNTEIKKAKTVSVTVKNASLKDALDKVFKEQPLSYQILDKTIVIKEKPEESKEGNDSGSTGQNITGTVTDEKGNPLQGVTVRVQGSNTIAITDSKGMYTIEVPDERSVLQFSYVGFQIAEQSVGVSGIVNIVLKEAISKLEQIEVVSTGYQTLPKERATGSFVQVNKELLNRRVSTNVLERLDGIAPGIFFNGSTKTTISTTQNNPNYGITIRGQNSFTTSH
jgi:hypothetical protein